MHYPVRLFAGVLTTSIVVFASPAHPACAAPDTTKLQAVLQSQYDKMNAAMAHGNVARYLSYHTADYSETDPQGRHPASHGREQDRVQTGRNAQWIKHWNATNSMTFHYHDTVKAVSMVGNSIAVTTEERSSIQPQLVELEQDVWVRQGGRWRMKQRQHGTMHGAEGRGGTPPNKSAAPSAA